MNEDPLALLPELLLALTAVAAVLLGAHLPRHKQWIVRLLAAAAALGALLSAAAAFGPPDQVAFDIVAVDVGLGTARIVVIAALLLVLALSVDGWTGHPREAELVALLLLSSVGTLMMAGADDLLLVIAAYLLASVPLYALAGFAKDAAGTEASLKLYLMGALFGVFLLVGITVLFGVGGATGYPQITLADAPRAAVAVGVVGVFAGLLFKIGGVPGHFWVPDTVQGAPPAVAAFVTTVPKIGALVAAYRLAARPLLDAPVDTPMLIAVLAALSMTLGNLAAFFQNDVRRLLGYSTISQVGYLLMAVAVAERSPQAWPALGFYLAAYAVTNLAAFAVVCELPAARTLTDYRGLISRHRWLAVTLVICLLGLLGTPPTAVFIGKLTVFTATLDGGLGWLVVLAAANTVASLFYYLRWLIPALTPPTTADPAVLDAAGTWARIGAYTAAAASVALGLTAGPVLTLLDRPLLP